MSNHSCWRRTRHEDATFTDEQITFAIKPVETGTPVAEVCRKMGVSDATLCNWRKKYGGRGPSELRRLRQSEEENRS